LELGKIQARNAKPREACIDLETPFNFRTLSGSWQIHAGPGFSPRRFSLVQ
jgi:hypothetical protein